MKNDRLDINTNTTQHHVVIGDSRHMASIEDQSVQLVVTSPPYWQLKDYGTDNQIGFHDSYESYINNLNLVWKECYRVLEDGCRMCINIGDQFARSVYYGRYKVLPIRTEIIKFCESIGFDYMGAVIWQKKTTTNTTGGASLMGSYPNPRNGVVSIDYEFILIFKKLGKPRVIPKGIKEASKMTKEEWKTYFDGHWYFRGAKQDGHIAVFPEELPKRLIKMFSFVGETVLDPFLGSGTTSLAAKNLSRRSIGYEINKEFLPYIEKKVGSVNIGVSEENIEINFSEEIKKLPYVFKDFHKFESKIDPRKLQYGSKINQDSSTKREEYYSVKEVLSPELIKLNNDLIIRLIGVKIKAEKAMEAMNFLRQKTRGQKVFLKYDTTKHDDANRLMAYVYLKNKTFINAHLIKQNFVYAVRDKAYKHKERFIKYEENNK